MSHLSTKSFPTPSLPTDILRLEIVNKDATVKHIEIEFSRLDQWSECWPGSLNIAEMLGVGLSKMIEADNYSVGSKGVMLNKLTGTISEVNHIATVNKPEFLLRPHRLL